MSALEAAVGNLSPHYPRFAAGSDSVNKIAIANHSVNTFTAVLHCEGGAPGSAPRYASNLIRKVNDD
jgi:hypothetical protein